MPSKLIIVSLWTLFFITSIFGNSTEVYYVNTSHPILTDTRSNLERHEPLTILAESIEKHVPQSKISIIQIDSTEGKQFEYGSIKDTARSDEEIQNVGINSNKSFEFLFDEHKTKHYNKGDVDVMEWFSTILSHHKWRKRHMNKVNERCSLDLMEYLQQMRLGTAWATKMYDASGSYNSQFFFGNDFWLGSKMECYELENSKNNVAVSPYPIAFYMVKLRVNLNEELTPVTRQLTVGLCMPRSCMSKDLESVVSELVREHVDSAPFNTTSLKTVSVRPVPGDYNIFDDVKFHIVGGVGAATFVLVFVATVYEWYLNLCRRSKNCFSDNEIECAGIHTNNNNNGVAKNREQRTISLVNGEFGNNGLMMKSSDMKNEKKPDIGQDLPSQLLLCFSALSNGKKILSLDKPSDNSLSCIHGLRFMSLAWIIMVHTYMQVFPVADNKSLRTVSERYFVFQTITNATFSVDTFFFISGLLVTILYYRTISKKITKTVTNDKSPTTVAPHTNIGNTISTVASDEIAGRQHQKQKQLPQQQDDSLLVTIKSNTIKFVTLFVYRLLRLTPAYLFVLGVDEIALRSAHNSSVFEPGIWDHVNCDNFWWRNALYINSLFAQSEMCMVWSWYMSNDTQFYVIGVILLLISVRHFKVAVFSMVVFLVSAAVTAFTISYQYEHNVRVEEPFALFDQLYDKPWSRIGPYIIGMATGWFLFKIDCKLRIPKPVVMLGWTLSLACMMSLIYGIGKDGLGVLSSSFYVALGHTAWGLSLSWLTIACCTGYGGPINSFLSCRGMLPFSRLTYCAYLVHPMLMCISSFQLDGPIHLHNGMILIIYLGNAVVSFLMSFAVSLGFEAPIVRLLKLILGGSSKED